MEDSGFDPLRLHSSLQQKEKKPPKMRKEIEHALPITVVCTVEYNCV